jgi:hypothetical protein
LEVLPQHPALEELPSDRLRLLLGYDDAK